MVRPSQQQVQGGSIFNRNMSKTREDLFRQEQMKNALPKSELGQGGMDATIKRNLIRKKMILGKVVPQNQINGGTMMSQSSDPLESVRLPKFVNGKKMNRNNIKISL
jgi:hypothetical protein